jgi:hypothetical protein
MPKSMFIAEHDYNYKLASTLESAFSLDAFLEACRAKSSPLFDKNKTPEAYKSHWLEWSTINAWYMVLTRRVATAQDSQLFDESLRALDKSDADIRFLRSFMVSNYEVTFPSTETES